MQNRNDGKWYIIQPTYNLESLPKKRGSVFILGFPGGSAVKNLFGDMDLICRLGRSLKEEMVTHSSNVAWRIPWTEEPGRAPDGVAEESDTIEPLNNNKY